MVSFFLHLGCWWTQLGNGQVHERKEDAPSLNGMECCVTLNESSSVVGQINLNHLTWQRRSGKLIIVIIALQLLRLTAALQNHQ